MQVPISIPTAGPVYRTAHRRRIVQGVEREPTSARTHKKKEQRHPPGNVIPWVALLYVRAVCYLFMSGCSFRTVSSTSVNRRLVSDARSRTSCRVSFTLECSSSRSRVAFSVADLKS